MRSGLVICAFVVLAGVPTDASELFGDWTLKCGAEIGALPTARTMPSCVLDETATNGTITVRAIAGGITASGSAAMIFLISRPVLAEAGLGLKVDGRILGASWIEDCTASDCESEVLLDRSFLSAFERGRAAAISVRDDSNHEQTIVLPLKGFTRGFNRLGLR